MNKFIQLLICLFLWLPFYAQADSATDAVTETITAMMKENNIPGVAVELYIDGKPHSYYFGYADRDKKTPINQQTIFELGSITKVMTSLLLAQQIDAANAQLDDPVTKYLPGLSNNFDDITLKDLATHTSGLPFSAPDKVNERAQLVKYLSRWEPKSASGDEWIYSNVGMGILGDALEAMTRKEDDQLYRAQILSPLKMQPIGFTVPKKWEKAIAQGYDRRGNPVKLESLDLFASAYAIKASANDMQRFLSAAIGLPGTPERIFYPMRMTQTAYIKLADRDQGLGWQIHPITQESFAHLLNEPDSMNLGPSTVSEAYEKPVYNGNALIDKTGATDGFRAYIAVIPNKKSGIVILTNKYISNGLLVNKARELLFKLAKVTPSEVKVGEAS